MNAHFKRLPQRRDLKVIGGWSIDHPAGFTDNSLAVTAGPRLTAQEDRPFGAQSEHEHRRPAPPRLAPYALSSRVSPGSHLPGAAYILVDAVGQRRDGYAERAVQYRPFAAFVVTVICPFSCDD